MFSRRIVLHGLAADACPFHIYVNKIELSWFVYKIRQHVRQYFLFVLAIDTFLALQCIYFSCMCYRYSKHLYNFENFSSNYYHVFKEAS